MSSPAEPLMVELARLERARHWISVRQPERALTELGSLSGDVAVSLDAQILRVLANLLTDQPGRALRIARQALADHGPTPELCRLLAHAFRGIGDEAEAEAAVLRGLELDPTDPDLLCLYAEICVRAGQLDKAQQLLDRAAAEAPESDAVMRARILIAHARGDAGTRRLVHDYLARDPENPDARALHLMVSAVRGDVGRAYSSSRRLVAADPGNADYVDAATELRLATHPLMWPLRPIMRFGPGVMWLVQVAVIVAAFASGIPGLMRVVTLVVVAWVAYSWIAPPLLRRWLTWRTR